MHRFVVGTFVLALAVGLVAGTATAAQAPKSAAAKAPAEVVNLNTATPAQLESLPGVGAKTAQRIIEYRQKNGGFKKAEELMNVRGIGEKAFLKLKTLITVTTRQERPAGQAAE